MRIRPASFATLLLVAVACRDDIPSIAEPTAVVHSLERVAGDSSTGIVAQPLTRLTVRALDSEGNPLSDIPVRFFVPLGSSGSIDTAIVRTNGDGEAQSGVWVLGAQSGEHLVRAHAQEVAAVFTALATPDAPVAMVAQAGDRQVTLAATAVRVPPTVRIIDRFGNGVPGVLVRFDAQGSTLADVEAISDSSGAAEASSWTPAGTSAMTLVATSPLLPSSQATFNARVVPVLFGIEFRATGVLPPRLHQALERAAARWVPAFTGHSGSSQVTLPAGSCGPTSPALSEAVRDIVVFVRVSPIDGHGRILASALPCAVHEQSGLPVVARITFDSSDVARYAANDFIDLIATHELGHALGFGTIWEQRGLVLGSGTIDPRFTGVAAAREYASAFAAATTAIVPVENTGGAGTVNRHWRASLFPVETMNGFLQSRTAPLSRITIGAMEDIGYRVDYAAADVYPTVAAFLSTVPPVEMRHEATPFVTRPRTMPAISRDGGRR